MEKGVVTEVAALARAGQEIAALVGTVGEHQMSTVILQHIPPKPEPEPATLEFASLTALVEFIGANRDGIALDKCVLHVEGPTRVALRGELTGEKRQRFTYAAAVCTDLARGFLGTMHGQEEFVVGLQTRFVDSDARPDVLRLVGKLKEQASIESEDDGVTQHVTSKAGVHLAQQVQIPNPVTLAAFRTFREVPQVASAMVLRVTSGPRVGLFEADGGAWALAATERVAQWLRDQDTQLPILS